MRIGLVVNPVAGLGGAVGLKGSDGFAVVAEALARGAVPRAGERTRRTLERLASRVPGARLLIAPGALGAEWAAGLPLTLEPVEPGPLRGTARDTRAAVALMGGADVVAFAGGDGTARDVAAAVRPGQAVLGIPCGVKMHSGVFAVTPEAAGAVLAECSAGTVALADAEVMDIDEDSLRAGRLAPRLFAHVPTPVMRGNMQAAKGGPRENASAALEGAAAEAADALPRDALVVIGPGTSAGAVMRAAGHEPTLLGIDALRAGAVVARDAGAAELERLAGDGPVAIVLGVTGRQGFLLGRGNQAISPTLLRRAGRAGLIVLATGDKLAALAEPRLWIDSGDPALDAALAGFVRVRTGRGRVTLMRAGPAL